MNSLLAALVILSFEWYGSTLCYLFYWLAVFHFLTLMGLIFWIKSSHVYIMYIY